MRFTITRENLQQGLGAVAGSIPTRTTLPVLSNILIEAEDGAVRMSGTDLDTAVSVRVPADVAEPGRSPRRPRSSRRSRASSPARWRSPRRATPS
jgi:DNA polymerase III sliding clamp (beta) subunit (PCNA family)